MRGRPGLTWDSVGARVKFAERAWHQGPESRAQMNPGLLAKLAWLEPDRESDQIAELIARLAEEDGSADDGRGWPYALWSSIERGRATRWSLPAAYSGDACARPLLVQRYAQLAGGSLTAVFVLSQHDAAVRRLIAAPESAAAGHWLRAIGEGRAFTTVGISHLTTSRRLARSRSRPSSWARGCTGSTARSRG